MVFFFFFSFGLVWWGFFGGGFFLMFSVLRVTSKLKLDLKTSALPVHYLDNMQWDLLSPLDVWCRLFYQFTRLTVSSWFGITIAATAAQKHFDEICREKGEGKGRGRRQIIRVKIIFFLPRLWVERRVLLPPRCPLWTGVPLCRWNGLALR